ncbi:MULTISPECIES: TonB-dependent receptor [unclassified Parabacteroides]|nr:MULTISPECIES: TonB-dependent receptor [unclassified Parabacteroides]
MYSGSCVSLYAQETTVDSSRRITLKMKQVELIHILSELEKQSGMFFSYESSLLTNLPKVSLSVKEELLTDCLKHLFSSLPIMYQINGRVVILKKKPRQVVISGFIRERNSSEALIGASVYQVGTRKGTASNNYGFFSLSLDPGDISLQFSYIGYKPLRMSFPFMEKDTLLTIELENNTALDEVVVYGSDAEKRPVSNTQMGTLEINQQTIRNTPVMFGEADIIKTLQLTPGVATGTEGFAGMYVRGGNVDENLFLVDGNPVYQINHLGGVFSAFNSEAIRGMEFFKGGFPARYGGRLSSVVDVHTKEGNMKEYHGSASIGLISGNLSFEGPLKKDKTSFMIALRRTWLDMLTIPAIAIANNLTKKEGDKARGRYAFHDLNLKLNHHFNERSRLFISLYNGNDVLKGGHEEFNVEEETPFSYDNHASLRWGNLIATAGWTYVFNNKLFGKLSGVFTQYSSQMQQTQEDEYGVKGEDAYEYSYNKTSSKTGITDFGLRSSFDYLPISSHHIRFGGDFLMHRFRPEYSQTRAFDEIAGEGNHIGAVYSNDLLWAKEFSAFAEDDWVISRQIRLNGGLRYSIFTIDQQTYMSLEPRLALRWLLKKNLSIKASYARMNQYVHLISDSYMNLPTDAWMPVTKRLKPLLSDQASLGLYYNLKGEYDFSVEGYYKRFENLLEYRDGYSFVPSFSSWEDKLTVGDGRAYGAEFMVRKQTGKTTGWIGYTLSWADRKFPEINDGKRFQSKYDNRHKLNIVAMHKISAKVEISAAWTYASGNRATLALENYESIPPDEYGGGKGNTGYGGYYSEPYELDHYEERNNYQLPAYHRLDLGINIYRPKKKGRMGIWNISIYNVYSRMNPFMIRKTWKTIEDPDYIPPKPPQQGGSPYDKYKSVPCFKTVGIMPVIPSISYTYKF